MFGLSLSVNGSYSAHNCVKIRSFLEIHHRDLLHSLHCQSKLNSQWIGVCQHMQHRTVVLSEINQHGYLVHEVTTFMDMIFNGEM
mgnify:CR=1 FL=1